MLLSDFQRPGLTCHGIMVLDCRAHTTLHWLGRVLHTGMRAFAGGRIKSKSCQACMPPEPAAQCNALPSDTQAAVGASKAAPSWCSGARPYCAVCCPSARHTSDRSCQVQGHVPIMPATNKAGLGNVMFRNVHILAAHLDKRLACVAQVVSAIVARRSASIKGSASEDDAGTRMADRADLTVIMARLQVQRPSTACQCW